MWRQRPPRSPPTYENVRGASAILSRLNAELIETHFGIGADIARRFMAHLVADRLFGDQRFDGWHYPVTNQTRPHRSRSAAVTPKPNDSAEANTNQSMPADELRKRVGQLEEEIHRLQARVRRLQSAGKTVIAQREAWSARTVVAEQRVAELIAELSSRPASRHDRFDALRRLIAKELHPDFCDGGGIEKLIRAEFFKRVWSQIEEIVERWSE